MPYANLIDDRYQIRGKIGSGGMGEIYRVRDLITSTEIALKRVTLAGENLSFLTNANGVDFRLALAQEFRLLASLRHPHIISVLDYGFDSEKQPYYTMDLLENPQTISIYGKTLDRKDKIELLIQVAQALTYLHRRGIIHRDLKPENILVVDGDVRVVDFGLAVQSNHMRRIEGDMLAGTLGYMAPEILLNEPPSERSDLYALGVIAYEMLTGEHPYNLSKPSQLMIDIIHNNLDFSLSKLDKDVVFIIEHLMAKNPEDRYEDASLVINDFTQAIDLPYHTDTANIRDSFIQAASFVGRKQELKQLTDALNKILPLYEDESQGSAWLLGGESGVGKSRLLEEIRALAMVEGALVLQGQNLTEGLLYQMWRSVMRRLILSTQLEDYQLSVLRDVVPDIDKLLNRNDIPNVSPMRGKGAVRRLGATIADVLRKQERPVVLLLEDLHWAEENLDILEYVLEGIKESNIFILGTYRNDEMPNLPERLPQMKSLILDRLNTKEIHDLSISIMGETVGSQKHVLDLLKRETEGNVFFLVEVVRVLAEESGKLSEIGSSTLPAAVFSGSIRTVINRRLSRVPIDAHPMLRLAAVFGREIDLNILKQIDPYMKFDNWLITCSNAAIIEIFGGQWRFSHDRIRDGILDALEPQQKPKLNEMVAEAVEAVYPGDNSYALRLMRHWAIAGNEEKEAFYALISAKQAFLISDYADALALLERAEKIHERNMPAEIYINQGDIHYHLGDYEQARERLRLALSCVMTDEEKATVLAIMGDMSVESGNYYRAERMLVEAEPVARENASPSTLARVLSSMGDVHLRQGNLEKASAYLHESSTVASLIDDTHRVLYVMNRLGTIAMLRNNLDEAEEIFQNAYFLASTSNNAEQVMILTNSLGNIDLSRHDYVNALKHFRSAMKMASTMENNHMLPLFLSNIAKVEILQGNYKNAQSHLQSALDISVSLDIQPLILHTLIAYSGLYYANGNQKRTKEFLQMVLNHPAYNRELKYYMEEKLMTWGISLAELSGMKKGLDFDTEIELLLIFDELEFEDNPDEKTFTDVFDKNFVDSFLPKSDNVSSKTKPLFLNNSNQVQTTETKIFRNLPEEMSKPNSDPYRIDDTRELEDSDKMDDESSSQS